MRQLGKIARLLEDQGYGFITGEDEIEYFFHRRLLKPGLLFQNLVEGQAVEFESSYTAKGPRALNVSYARADSTERARQEQIEEE